MDEIEFKNMSGANKNRRKITIVEQFGNTMIADLDFVDPQQINGTPITAEVMKNFQNAIKVNEMTCQAANGTANTAKEIANSANTMANTALNKAENAVSTAVNAKVVAEAAQTTAGNAERIANEAKNMVESFNGAVDTALSSTSINPVQNRVVNEAINLCKSLINSEMLSRIQADDNLTSSVENLKNKFENPANILVANDVKETLSYYATWKIELGNIKIIGGATPQSEGCKTLYFRMNDDTEKDVFDTLCLGVWASGRYRTSNTGNGWQYTYETSKSGGYVVQISNGSYWFAIGI